MEWVTSSNSDFNHAGRTKKPNPTQDIKLSNETQPSSFIQHHSNEANKTGEVTATSMTKSVNLQLHPNISRSTSLFQEQAQIWSKSLSGWSVLNIDGKLSPVDHHWQLMAIFRSTCNILVITLLMMLIGETYLRWTMLGPDSSYSCLEIHICWKVAVFKN